MNIKLNLEGDLYVGFGIFEKIINNHFYNKKREINKLVAGKTIPIKVEQVLTHDIGGTMVFLEFEALGIPKIRSNLAVVYADHNLLQAGFMNADDHRFLQSASAKYGAYFSKPGNGICHQVHLERFASPGNILLGSDSHTSTSGAVGMVAIGVGGIDVALAMAGKPFYLKMPHIVNVYLKGKLNPFVSAKDIILFLLKKLTIKGGVNKVFEFSGPGIKYLDVTERATITNMGSELGATASIFPSDEITYHFLNHQKRENEWLAISADQDASYEERIEIDLNTLEPLIAKPHQPDNVVEVKTIVGMRVDQIAIGGCTNSSIKDLLKVAYILKGKTIHPNVSVALNPASRQILRGLNKLGVLDWLLNAGVRLLENGCGPCIGMGFSPPTGGVSIRTYNRNFIGRSGTQNAFVYLTSPETAAASALTGIITDPRDLGMALIEINKEIPYIIDDSMIIPPAKNSRKVKVIKGPNIISLSLKEPIKRNIELDVQLKLGDNITTDDILPSGSNVLPFRSNLPKISNFTFINLDPKFVVRMKKNNKGVIIAGHNYGQGSSREHAALVLMYLGINIIIARSFSRIHRRNLINFGIVPLLFFNQNSYQKIDFGNKLFIQLENLDKKKIKVKNIDKNRIFYVTHDLDFREKSIVRAGGVLAYYKQIDK